MVGKGNGRSKQVNKQEAIEKIKNIETLNIKDRMDDKGVDMVIKNQVIDIISKIDEPQKPVVPKFVADKIEYCKKTGDYGLFHAMDYCYQYKESSDWLECNEETFALALIYGYEVEKERLYTVEFPTGQQLYKNYQNGGSAKQIVIKFANHADKDGHFTKRELEETGFEWVFDCKGVEVKEVGNDK